MAARRSFPVFALVVVVFVGLFLWVNDLFEGGCYSLKRDQSVVFNEPMRPHGIEEIYAFGSECIDDTTMQDLLTYSNQPRGFQ